MTALRLPAALLLLVLGACTTQSLDPVPSNPEGFAAWSDASPAYRFAAGDKLRVQFLLTPEMNESVLVAPDGQVGLRAAGQVRAAGLSAPELERGVAQAALRILREPIVTVSLEEAAGSAVLVGGAVNRPGAVPMAGPRGVMEAVLLAGGLATDARMSEIARWTSTASPPPPTRRRTCRSIPATSSSCRARASAR
jgi:polysaccharide biosynthesis/export protein PslD